MYIKNAINLFKTQYSVYICIIYSYYVILSLYTQTLRVYLIYLFISLFIYLFLFRLGSWCKLQFSCEKDKLHF